MSCMGAKQVRAPVHSLGYPDLFYFRAAEGWFELGQLNEALEELDGITSRQRSHGDVLYLRWRIFVALKKWDRCLVISRALTAGYPDEVRSWIVLAETYYLLGEVEKAFRIASVNAAEFPESWHLLYDAACYACLIGKFQEAQQYFNLAMQMGDAKSIRQQTLDNPNLEPLWEALPPPKSHRKARV
jgi:tetratricopeptide (TPR) repeat protein